MCVMIYVHSFTCGHIVFVSLYIQYSLPSYAETCLFVLQMSYVVLAVCKYSETC